MRNNNNLVETSPIRTVIVADCIAILVLMVFFISIIASTQKTASDEKQVISSDSLPSVSLSGDVEFEEFDRDSGVIVKGVSGLVFSSGSTKQTVDISNNLLNKYDMIARIYLGDGTVLYESDLLHPGEYVNTITISEALNFGVYKNSVLAFSFFTADENHAPVTQCEFPIEICSK